MRTVCILAAGSGTRMGEYSAYVHKALLPIGGRAAITHLIESYPRETTRFVIAVGWLADQLVNYLTLAHPQHRIEFVRVEKFRGPGSGPGHSLLECAATIDGPFDLVCADTLWKGHLPSDEGSWMAVSPMPREESAAYLNAELDGERIRALRDKVAVDPAHHRAFVGLARIAESAVFFAGLREARAVDSVKGAEQQLAPGFAALIARGMLGSHPLPSWTDIGTIDKYERALRATGPGDFRKHDELLLQAEGRVIKFFRDDRVAEHRVVRARLKPEVFPDIAGSAPGFLAYAHVPGGTFYERGDGKQFERKLLPWLEQNLWGRAPATVDQATFEAACGRFYQAKTLERLGAFLSRNPDLGQARIEVNGTSVRSDVALLAEIPWSELRGGVPTFIHGDLQFDNIVVTDDRASPYRLIDWRQDFGGLLEIGDLYYDLAKLLTGIETDLSALKRGRYRLLQEANRFRVDAQAVNDHESCTKALRAFTRRRGMDWNRVRLLSGLILINMAGLHRGPVDRLLYLRGLERVTAALRSADQTGEEPRRVQARRQ